MVFPRWGMPQLINVIRSSPAGEDGEDSPTYSPRLVIEDRPGRYSPRRTVADRYVQDGLNVSGSVMMPYTKGDTITNSDELVVRDRDGGNAVRYKVFTVHRRDLNKRPSHWEIEVARYA